MLCKLNAEQDNNKWLQAYWSDFRRRFISLLSYSFNTYPVSLALSILVNKTISLGPISKCKCCVFLIYCYFFVIITIIVLDMRTVQKICNANNSVLALSKETLDVYFTSYDLKRLQMYSNNMADYHLIMDLLPSLARLYFLNMMGDTHFSAAQLVRYTLLYI